MNYKIAVVPGDGIGPEVVGQAIRVLDKVGEKYGHTFEYTKVLAGGCAIDATGKCLPQETIDTCKAGDAVLLGAVGGWKWDTLPGSERPEMALLGLSQPFSVAAQFTGMEGKYLPLKETVRGFKEILEGKHDDIPEQMFLFAGSIDEVVEKYENSKK